MNHFHNAKIIATMWPAIDKETVLSKVINQIDTFRITLSHGEEDIKRKYVNMILKLDNSKSILLDIQWPEIRTRSREETQIKKNQKLRIKYSESFKHEEGTLFVDYEHLDEISVGVLIHIDHNAVILEVTKKIAGGLETKVIQGGEILINRLVEFEKYIPKLPFFGEGDKKHVVWGIEHKVSMMAISYIRDAEDVKKIKDFLNHIWGLHVKIIAKIVTKEALKNIKHIIDKVDGIHIDSKKLAILTGGDGLKEQLNIVNLCNKIWKPVLVTVPVDASQAKASKEAQRNIMTLIQQGVDAFLLTKETAVGEFPIEAITLLYDTINNPENKVTHFYKLDEIPAMPENTAADYVSITDYVIYNAYRASKELKIKAIICPTETGYTPARLSSLKPDVPIIAFTKNDDAFRYLNLLRWVKGYKIASTFDYENIKQIGKEIIRILFKGNISLDDKIIIVHSSIEQNVKHMINGFEIYKFKDI